MNFINVKLDGDHIAKTLTQKVPEIAESSSWKKDMKERIIFGIRPEDVNTESAFKHSQNQ